MAKKKKSKKNAAAKKAMPKKAMKKMRGGVTHEDTWDQFKPTTPTKVITGFLK